MVGRADAFVEREPGGEAVEQPETADDAGPPAAAPAARQHRGGGAAAHAVRRADEHHGVVLGGRAGEAEPGGEGRATEHRRQPEVEGDEAEAGADQHLGRGQRVVEPLGTEPQQPGEVDADRRGGLWVELRALVDEGGGLAGAGDLLERAEQGGEASARAAPDELDHGAARQPAAEHPVEGRHRGGERRLGEPVRPPPTQLRRADDERLDVVGEGRPDLVGVAGCGGLRARHGASVGAPRRGIFEYRCK